MNKVEYHMGLPVKVLERLLGTAGFIKARPANRQIDRIVGFQFL